MPIPLLLNPCANRGRAGTSLRRFFSSVPENSEAAPEKFSVIDVTKNDVGSILKEDDAIVIAGGDGTVHRVLNALWKENKIKKRAVGFLGLGSSCDFAKWHQRSAKVTDARERIRVRQNDIAELRPLHVTLRDGNTEREVLCILTLSVGIAAEANAFFSCSSSIILKTCRAFSISMAIFYSAFIALVKAKPISGVLSDGKGEMPFKSFQISVLRTPWLGGLFRFPTQQAPSSNNFDGFVSTSRSVFGLLSSLARVLRGSAKQFVHYEWRDVGFRFEHVQKIEIDGELYEAEEIRVRAASDCIRVMGRGLSSTSSTAETRLVAYAKVAEEIDQRWRKKWIVSGDLLVSENSAAKALARLLSSIARTESLENELLQGLRNSPLFKSNAVLERYIESHCADEARHGAILRSYMQGSGLEDLGLESRAGKLMRNVVLPLMQAPMRLFPVMGLSLLLSYEKIAQDIYAQIARRAYALNFENLGQLIQEILRDEHRHVLGLEAVCEMLQQRKSNAFFKVFDRIAARAMIRWVAWDTRMDDAASHNKGFASAFENFGCDRSAFMQQLEVSKKWLTKRFQ